MDVTTPDGGQGGQWDQGGQREPGSQWEQPGGQQPYTPQQAAIAQEPRNGIGIAALVLGILAILTCWIPVIGFILGLIALILGFVGRSRVKKGQATNGGVAITGIVLGILSVIVNILLVIFVGVGVFAFLQSGGGNTIGQLQDCIAQAQNAGNPAAVQQAIQQCQDQAAQQLPGGGGGQ